jgi:hypothetical protein
MSTIKELSVVCKEVKWAGGKKGCTEVCVSCMYEVLGCYDV